MEKFIFTLQGTVPRSYKILRQELGKGILLGLEILVAGDIIGTVVTEPTSRTFLGHNRINPNFLSLSLEVEIEEIF